MRKRSRDLLTAMFLMFLPFAAVADDVVVELGAGDEFVVQDATATDRLRIDESADVWKGNSLYLHDPGTGNFFAGRAGNASLTGWNNTGVGLNALFDLDSGANNAAFGGSALTNNDTGNSNSAFGYRAMETNTGGSQNSAFGHSALFAVQNSTYNSAFGYFALHDNTSGNNSAFGARALQKNSGASGNSAFGYLALQETTTGGSNAAFGMAALNDNVSGTGNSAFGSSALSQLSSGSNNLALGSSAGNSLTSGSNNIYIENGGVSSETGAIRIGASHLHTDAFMAGIDGNIVTGSAVLVTSSGELGVAASSLRFKEKVRDMGEASRALFALRPVRFRYREDVGGDTELLQYGLIAEEVAEVSPELVAFGEDGAPFAVRYQFLAPMLLNEVQKQQRTIEGQAAVIEEQRTAIAALAGRLEQLESRLGSELEGSNR